MDIFRAAFSALRTYALYTGQYKLVISAVVFALSSVPLVVNMVVRVSLAICCEQPHDNGSMIGQLTFYHLCKRSSARIRGH